MRHVWPGVVASLLSCSSLTECPTPRPLSPKKGLPYTWLQNRYSITPKRANVIIPVSLGHWFARQAFVSMVPETRRCSGWTLQLFLTLRHLHSVFHPEPQSIDHQLAISFDTNIPGINLEAFARWK